MLMMRKKITGQTALKGLVLLIICFLSLYSCQKTEKKQAGTDLVLVLSDYLEGSFVNWQLVQAFESEKDSKEGVKFLLREGLASAYNREKELRNLAGKSDYAVIAGCGEEQREIFQQLGKNFPDRNFLLFEVEAKLKDCFSVHFDYDALVKKALDLCKTMPRQDFFPQKNGQFKAALLYSDSYAGRKIKTGFKKHFSSYFTKARLLFREIPFAFDLALSAETLFDLSWNEVDLVFYTADFFTPAVQKLAQEEDIYLIRLGHNEFYPLSENELAAVFYPASRLAAGVLEAIITKKMKKGGRAFFSSENIQVLQAE